MANVLDIIMKDQVDYANQLKVLSNQSTELINRSTEAGLANNEVSSKLTAANVVDTNKAIALAKNMAISMGLDPDAADNRINKLSRQRIADEAAYMQKAEEYKQLNATSFFENPLMFVVNTFKSDAVGREMNALESRIAMSQSAIRDINADIQSGAETARLISKDISDVRQALELKQIGAAAELAASELEIKGFKQNIDMLKAVQEGNKDIADTYTKQQSLLFEAQRINIARTNAINDENWRNYQKSVDAYQRDFSERELQLRKEQFLATVENREARLDLSNRAFDLKANAQAWKEFSDLTSKADNLEKQAKSANSLEARKELMQKAADLREKAQFTKLKAKMDHDSKLIQPYRDAIERFGFNIRLPEDPQAAADMLKKISKDRPQEYRALLNVTSGLSIAPNVPTMGLSPVEALDTYQAVPTIQIPKGMSEAFVTYIKDTYDTLVTPVNEALPSLLDKVKNKDEKVYLVNNKVYERYAQDVNKPDSSNIMAPKLPELANTPLARNGYFAAMVADGLGKVTVENVVSRLEKDIAAGDVNINEAAEFMSRLYDTTIKYNNAYYNFPGIGLPLMEQYKHVERIGEKDEEFNLANKADALRLLVLRNAKSVGFLDKIFYSIKDSYER